MASSQRLARYPAWLQVGALGKLRGLPWVPVLIIASVIFMALLAPWISPHDPIEPNLTLRYAPPSLEYPLGTDNLGRGIMTRLFYGARVTLIVAGTALGAGAAIGLFLGLVAGYIGGWVDTVISRMIDALLAMPPIFFGILLAVTLKPGLASVVLALSVVLWARFARVVRGEVLSVRERDFVAQAKINGCSAMRIMAVHLFPNVLSSFMVLISMNVGWVIITEAVLSFLGAGIPPPTPSWGRMISEGQAHLTTAWWISITPGVAITLTVLAFNLLGDWLRDHLDPRLRDQL